MSKNKLQTMLIDQLFKYGQIELLLPDGVTLEIGCTQENEDGEIVKRDDYCWVIAKHQNRLASIDPYNVGISLIGDEKAIVLDEEYIGRAGEKIRQFQVV